MPDDKSAVDPAIFFRNVGSDVTDDSGDSEEPEVDAEENQEAEEQETDTDQESEALSPENDGETDDKTDSDSESEPKAEKVTDDYEVNVILDGEKTTATIAQLRDSYERHKVSTQRFEAASKMKKEAEAYRVQIDKQVEGFKANVNRLGTDVDFFLDFFERSAPQTLHKAFEKYADRLDQDNKLYEADPAAYNALVASRRQGQEARTEQEKLRAEKADFEARRKAQEDQEVAERRESAILVLNENLPKAMNKFGLLPKGMTKHTQRLMENDLRQFMYDNFKDGDSVTREYIYACAEKFSRDPDVKETLDGYNGKSHKNGKKTTEDGDEMRTVEPKGQDRSNRIISPGDFFKGKITSVTGRR